ncbi:MAG: electron transfer flavoprotein subunit beta/FixA family protein [Desulfobacteraceae bacterium]|nr:electron transfer flavoprotein subunit beta/FixA family protein [Desulfobacteraceae bacterium]
MEKIVVCLKPVPDPKQWDEVSMDPQTQTLIREGIPSVINPLDKHAIEAALSIRDVHGGEVVLLSMAPPSASSTLREGLAMGADRAVLLSDLAFAGSDTLATAHVLAAGCRWLGDVDLIICGNMSIDGSTAQVGSQLAELLDLPNVMHVIDLDLHDDGAMVITRKIEHGFARLAGALPLVLSVRKELNKPRYTSFTGILAAESKEIKILSNEDLKISSAVIGIEGSPTQMAGIELRRFERARERLDGSVEEIVESLAERIYQYGII